MITSPIISFKNKVLHTANTPKIKSKIPFPTRAQMRPLTLFLIALMLFFIIIIFLQANFDLVKK